MEKLELKHLAAYLPYQLGFKLLDYKCDYVVEEYGICNGYYMIGDGIYYTFKYRNTAGKNFNNFKPILRPLSDLANEITIDKITFVPIEYKAFKRDIESIIEFQNGFLHYKGVKYGIIEKLLEWHFDIYGLIDKGLAIDINTLKFTKDANDKI